MTTSKELELAVALEQLERKKKEVRELEEHIAFLISQTTPPDPETKHSSASQSSSQEKKKPGVRYRKGRQGKGGTCGPGCFEETMWDPKIIMPALGLRPIGHVRTCFPRKNGDFSAGLSLTNKSNFC